MIYLIVVVISAAGIVGLLLGRSILRSRNVRRIVRSVKKGFLNAESRISNVTEDIPAAKPNKSPRAAAVELQQVRTLLREAEKAIAKQDVKSAERSLIQALTIHPDTKDVKAKLAHLYLDTCREQKAEAMYRELLQECSEPALFANLGLSCYKQGKFVEACEAYQEALNMDPKEPQRSYDLGRACFAARKFADAAPLLKKAAERLNKDTQLLHLLAQCYMRIQDEEHAEEIYREINRLEPRDEEVKEKIAQLAQAV